MEFVVCPKALSVITTGLGLQQGDAAMVHVGGDIAVCRFQLLVEGGSSKV